MEESLPYIQFILNMAQIYTYPIVSFGSISSDCFYRLSVYEFSVCIWLLSMYEFSVCIWLLSMYEFSVCI